MGFRHEPELLRSFYWYSDSLSDFPHISGRLNGLESDGYRWCHLLQPLTLALFSVHCFILGLDQRRAVLAALGSVLKVGQHIGRHIISLCTLKEKVYQFVVLWKEIGEQRFSTWLIGFQLVTKNGTMGLPFILPQYAQ